MLKLTYKDIAKRTGGDVYLGVVGPVRAGKSTFVKRFAELMIMLTHKKENTVMKKWRCTICGEIVESDVAPEKCPLCRAPGE